MGMRDENAIYADSQAVTVVGDTPSTNVYDSGSVNTDIGANDELWANAKCAVAAASGGAATLQAVLQDSPDNAAWTDRLAGPVLALADIVEGADLLQAPLPVGLARYTRIAWRVGTAALTAGNFTAYLSTAIQRNVARPSGFSVS